MPPRTSRDLVPPLRASAFRRRVCDARTDFVRRIKTAAQLPSSAATGARRA